MEACFPFLGVRKRRVPPPPVEGDPHHRNIAAAARTFSFEELAEATRNFRDEYLVAGREPSMYRGRLKSVNQVVAMKLQHLVDRNNVSTEQRNSEFLARVLMLNALRHPNLVNLIGFCADGNHRILVHEYLPLGSLEDHLHDPSPDKGRLDWSTRMNIAADVARGLEYLHGKGVVCCYLRSSDVLLGVGDGYHYPKLSQYELAKDGQLLDGIREARDFPCTIAPETAMCGKVCRSSDVYSFGVVLLEMITGRRPFSPQAAEEDRDLVTWVIAHKIAASCQFGHDCCDVLVLDQARTLLEDRVEFRRMADPALQGRYPSLGLKEALTVASMCIHQDPAMRSPIGAVVTDLARLAYDRSS
ncbi:serine/threonine-protein kinase PBL27 isoform X1 [Lolium perenne]|uniref:serine/threonine-protein kinase PBL27 isoform X1 n=1 Tax=Lolium perenne TaxID=4522 RepID=UPI0021F648C2|nr:serine/threonine-protein kinase PBL27-like isoform X1 [Lolium perenne]